MSVTGHRRSRVDRWLAIAATAAAVAVVLLTGWRSPRGWVPTTDWALIEAQVRAVGHQWPSLGSPSALGFHHPGPLPVLALAPLYHLFGADPHALLMSTATLNAAALAGAAWTAWRRGGLVLVVLTLATLAWLAGSLPPGFLADPWNPWMAVIPFAWLLLLVWSVTVGDLVSLPVAVLVGSFVAQAHVGYVPIVGVLALLALGALAWPQWRDRRTRRHGLAGRGPAIVVAALSAAVLLGTWALPLSQQLFGAEGNAQVTVRALTRPDALPRLTAGGTAGLVSRELGLTAPWLGFDEPVQGLERSVVPGPVAGALVPLVLLAVGLWASWRDPTARRFVLVVATADAAGVAAMSRLEATHTYVYVVRFSWVLGAFTVLATVWALVCRAPWRRTRAVAAVLAGAMLAGGLVRVVALDASATVPVYDPAVHALEQSCVADLLPPLLADAGDAPVHVQGTEFWPIIAAPVINELERTGASVSVDPSLGFFLNRPGRPSRPDESLLRRGRPG